MTSPADSARLVTVCDSCLRACCWQGEFFCGEFFCEDYKTAGTIEKAIAELIELGLEHSDWWKEERE